ncbi:hypothetical protein H072_4965 [Dactylellina haptotyla CBS 200.50]|uniref:Serine carboxypeptidase S28 n=1 Tax=Dactylellina haptotyla (strain CBS 200.50) TaxID=1284197 RepID=S8AJ27_DACHA|nr:hypothetical protein H072_4965 [Dactylellina haptotyla CBS 200.50]
MADRRHSAKATVSWCILTIACYLISIAPVVDARMGTNRLGGLSLRLAKEKQQKSKGISGHASVKIVNGTPVTTMNAINSIRNITEHSIEIPVDHHGSINETFPNRYWTSEQYYAAGGPIFLFDCAEVDASDLFTYALEGDLMQTLMKEFGGLGIVWEHRYYGKSKPKSTYPDITVNTPVEAFQFLDTEQSLLDIQYFADRFKSERFPKDDVTPKGSAWVFLGCSYGGVRGSLMRQKYPETIFASFSSSAPVEAQLEMTGYFEQIYRSASKEDPACMRNIHSAITYIDEELEKGGNSSDTIKNLFLGPGGAANDNGRFAELLTAQLLFYPVVGMRESVNPDHEFSLSNLCDWLNNDNGEISPSEGWERSGRKNGKWIATKWAQYDSWQDLIVWFTGAYCGGYKANLTPTASGWECELNKRFGKPDDIAWQWQVCSEWGYGQVANVGPNQISSKFNNAEFFKYTCDRQFPNATESGRLPKFPLVKKINDIYGGWLRPQARTFYTYGESDSWSVLGFFSNETGAPGNVVSHEIPGPETKNKGNRVFGYALDRGVHCQDFSGGPQSKESIQLFSQALRSWLPYFVPANKSGGKDGGGKDGKGGQKKDGKGDQSRDEKTQQPGIVSPSIPHLNSTSKMSNFTLSGPHKLLNETEPRELLRTMRELKDIKLQRRMKEWAA